MSDRPQTDEETYHSSRYDGEEIPGFDYVHVDFARSLERQRNELLEALEAVLNSKPGTSTERCVAIAKAECAIAKAKQPQL